MSYKPPQEIAITATILMNVIISVRCSARRRLFFSILTRLVDAFFVSKCIQLGFAIHDCIFLAIEFLKCELLAQDTN